MLKGSLQLHLNKMLYIIQHTQSMAVNAESQITGRRHFKDAKMKFRKKVVLAILLASCMLFALTLVGSRIFLLNGFIKLENNQVNDNIERVDSAINQVLYSLSTFTADWAHWDDAYSYVLGKNPSFPASNIKLAAMINSNINLLMYFDKAGKLLVGAATDIENHHQAPYPVGLNKYIYPSSPLIRKTDLNHDTQGFIALPSGIMLIAISTLSDGNKTAPPLGALVSGRYLSSTLINKISATTKFDVNLIKLAEINKNPALKTIFESMVKQSDKFITPINNEQTSAYFLLRDINKNPIGMIKVIMPRLIYQTGIETLTYYIGSVLALVLLLSLLLWWLLKKLIILRLEYLNNQILKISNEKVLSRRVTVTGNDELASVSTAINFMLKAFQNSQDKLEKKSNKLTGTISLLKQEIKLHKITQNELLLNKTHLAHLAHHDSLTGLHNRLYFIETFDILHELSSLK